MKAGDLTTVANVKEWLNTAQQAFPANSDVLLGHLVSRASSWVQTSYLHRSIPPASLIEKYNGAETQYLSLRSTPIIAVSEVVVGNNTVPARTQPGTYGFAASDTALFVELACFPRGFQNVQVSYSAGFQVTEQATVPTGAQIDVKDLAYAWNCDRGVAYADTGVSLSLVDADPAQGQYAIVDTASGSLAYAFNAADEGAAVIITHGYTPDDLVQAVTELVGEAYKRRGRIGEVSQSVGNGQTVSFNVKECSEFTRATLDSYRDVVPR